TRFDCDWSSDVCSSDLMGLFEFRLPCQPQNKHVSMVNYYDILKVSPKASRTEIKSAYRRLARKLHPDRNNGSQETALKFAAIAEIGRASCRESVEMVEV